jgi:hypothetical protein
MSPRRERLFLTIISYYCTPNGFIKQQCPDKLNSYSMAYHLPYLLIVLGP